MRESASSAGTVHIEQRERGRLVLRLEQRGRVVGGEPQPLAHVGVEAAAAPGAATLAATSSQSP